MAARPTYQTEPAALCELIWDQGSITALQMMRIAAWKSARGLASLTLNSEEAIRTWTESALSAIRPWRDADVLVQDVDWIAWREAAAMAIGSKRKGTGLLALDGFGYPMASAFLALLAPSAFPVIDRWTVKALYGAATGNFQRSLVYVHFAQTLASHAVRFPWARTIHQVDQAVMAAALGCAHDERPCECLPFPVTRFPS
jgi:hypothetical protein